MSEPCFPSIILSLCREFHSKGWMTGTGGALCLQNDKQEVIVTPSGVLKERLQEKDLVTVNLNGDRLSKGGGRLSSCWPNFKHIFDLRPDTRCILHLHSTRAVLASLIWPGDTFYVSHLHMVKAMRGHNWDDLVKVPIIENQATEDGIAELLETAVRENPGVDAVIIRRHGLYVWGTTWQQAKVQAEALDWLLEIAIEMHREGLHPGGPPVSA